MWIFTRYGFYSIACARKQDGGVDTETVMVRARCRSHLCALQRRLPALATYEIRMTPDRDYACRIIVPKRVWAAVLFDLAAEQEWSNFKNETAIFQGDAGRDYVGVLHDVWARMARLQQRPAGSVRVEWSADGVIVNAENLAADDVVNQKVLCPECGRKVFAAWPEGWDAHAEWACDIDGSTPEEKKKNYKKQFRHLFR
jgi:hypothetical protein